MTESQMQIVHSFTFSFLLDIIINITVYIKYTNQSYTDRIHTIDTLGEHTTSRQRNYTRTSAWRVHHLRSRVSLIPGSISKCYVVS